MTTVPYQLDELIASLSTSHIGNEAIELAKLQAQLQQSLQAYPQGAPFPTSPVQSPTFSSHNGPPANTPVSRTPSWATSVVDPATAISMGPGRTRRRSSIASAASFRAQLSRLEEDFYPPSGSAASSSGARYDLDQDMMMEDVEEEAEVDASLNHISSPSPSSSSHATSPIQFSHPNSTHQAYSPTTLAYVLNDPFLTHQLQIADQRNRQPSYFAQLATAHQHTSPFHRPSQNPPPISSAPPPNSSTQSYPQHHLRLTIDTTASPFTTHR